MGLLRRSGAGSLDALVVGLGNPGRQYERTRHNVGFMVIDLLAERAGTSFRAKYNGRFAETRLGDARVGLLEPETYMNLSGSSVGGAVRFYKLAAEQVIVVHDDIELAPGDVRPKAGGGLKGHNGLRSLADALGSRDFLRVRVGVGRPGRGDRRDVADYVLARFEPDEDVDGIVRSAADAVERLLAGDVPPAG